MTALLEQIAWQTFEQAKDQSARNGKAILLDFSNAPD